jgi:hypothetical protein
MYKTAVITIFLAFVIAVLYFATDMKNAYKILPGSTSGQLEVPPYVDWREFIPQSGKFKVDLPAVPQYAKEAVAIPNTDKKRRYEMYASEKLNGSIFMISLITYPSEFDTSNAKEMLHSVIDELVTSNPNGRLTEIRDTTFQTLPSIDFQLLNNDFHIQGKDFMINNTIYLLTYVSKKDEIDQKDYRHFIESFDLLPRAMQK